MRKKRLNLAAVLLALGLVGCASGSSENETTTAFNEQPTETVAKTQEQTEEATEAETETEEEKLYSDEMRDITPMQLVKEMHVGWNLGNTLDSSDTGHGPGESPQIFETAWGAQYTSQIQMDKVLEAGYDVVRIPVSWGEHIYDDGKCTIDEAWMDRVQEIVDFVYKRGAYVILNTHHEEWYKTFEDDKEEGKKKIAAVWKQIGERFADYGDHLIFEGLNEPRKKGTGVEWTGDKEARDVINEYMQTFVDTIRGLGGKNAKRCLMITGYAASSSKNNLAAIKLPEDDHLIVSVHAYIPYNFALNKEGTSTWNNDTRDIDELMKNLDELFISKGIPVIIGEFGAMNKENLEERISWVKYYISAAKKVGTVCVWWDNHSFRGNGENFGLLHCNGMNITWKYPELVTAMVEESRK